MKVLRVTPKATVIFIESPPGTGKTELVAAVTEACAESFSERVLLVSQANLAVDTATWRLLDSKTGSFRPGDIVRLGRHEKISDSFRKQLEPISAEKLVESMIMDNLTEEERMNFH